MTEEDTMASSASTRISQVGTVGVPTSDQERALEFYVGTLGFEKRLDAPFGEGQRWVEVAPAGAATSVALLPSPPGTAIGVDTGIRLFSTDAEADHADLLKRGVDADPEILRFEGVPPMFSFRDPDGNTLYLVESR
jgi:catechol 2,3-dioxygenase-like lactoylglutathione lyase family enzyme